ncbi:MAG: diacylglycerol kinase family protein [Clostridiales bacterium]|nr:diacylglycerol kinase family protein [Clostridiales bacterium]
MKKTSKKIIKSFKDAIKGILYIYKTQRNFRIQTVCFVIATATAFILKLSLAEIAIIIFAGGLVMVGEMINTGMETLVDLISPEYHPLAGRIKDIAAGAVLVSSIIAVIIGIIIFLPAIIELF